MYFPDLKSEFENVEMEFGNPRKNAHYREWRNAVLERDGYKCQVCGYDKVLHAHHIRPFGKDEDGRYDVFNGITLCKRCHKEHHFGANDKDMVDIEKEFGRESNYLGE